MKPMRVALAVLALSVPTSAHAALIGLAGVDYDPPPINITQSGPFTVEQCSNHTDTLPGTYFCVFYNAFYNVTQGDQQVFQSFDSIFSFDFLLFDGEGQAINSYVVLDQEFSDLPFIEQSQFAANGFHLSGATIFPTEPCELRCPPVIDAIAFYVAADVFHPDVSDFQVQTLAVNGVSVPEPATLLLLGPAALLLLRRRTRRART